MAWPLIKRHPDCLHKSQTYHPAVNSFNEQKLPDYYDFDTAKAICSKGVVQSLKIMSRNKFDAVYTKIFPMQGLYQVLESFTSFEFYLEL